MHADEIFWSSLCLQIRITVTVHAVNTVKVDGPTQVPIYTLSNKIIGNLKEKHIALKEWSRVTVWRNIQVIFLESSSEIWGY